jgi:hypothetical protein
VSKVISPFFLLINPVTEITFNEERYRNAVFKFIGGTSTSQYPSQLKRLMLRQRFRETFNASAKKIEKFGQLPHLRTNAKPGKIWALYQAMLNYDAEVLSEFSECRKKIEDLILFGFFEKADILLEDGKKKFGESLWYIRNKILLLSLKGENSDLQLFCASSKERSPEKLFRYIINCFQLITDSDDASLRLKNLVQSYVDEFSEGKQAGAASLLSLIFVPSPLKGVAPYFESLEYIQVLPLVDQYVLLQQWLECAIADSIRSGEDLFPELRSVVGELAEGIKDPIFCQMHLALQGAGNHKSTGDDLDLIPLYNSGKYSEVIEIFSRRYQELDSPLAYANLVAKSAAHLGIVDVELERKGLVRRIIADLISIYRISSFRKQSEDSLISTIIKLRGAYFSSSLQFCLYKAIPLQFAVKEVNFAAQLAITSDRQVTPFGLHLLTWRIDEFGLQYIELEDETPSYRFIKFEIAFLVHSSNEPSIVDQKLQELSYLCPLRKDFLELYSLICLHYKKFDALMLQCAQSLSADSNSYICFPMEWLLTSIESLRSAEIEAVIVAYYYSRHISTKRDYILNEAFEEYLMAASVRKPSELLARKNDITPLEVIFFRDICNVEIMDFLSCFSNTNELRSERVLILDLLLEKGVVESAQRMREVEKIVSQVIVDAGTSEFNRAKIFVDEAAILKQTYDEIYALCTTYQQAVDEGDDRINLYISNSGFLSSSYISGSKNSLVLRVYNILRDAFLNDEMHGFDKNLSTEIRHGFFSNLMLARLQEKCIVTEMDEVGEYKENSFWEGRNSFLTAAVWQNIDSHLRKFSADFNDLLAEVEEWMKIKGKVNVVGVFEYQFSIDDFSRLKRVISQEATVAEVALYIFGLLWRDTEFGLNKIRERINVEFRERVDNLFETLIGNITSAKGSAAAVSLMSSITHAREGIKEDITTVAEWFRRDKNPGVESRLLNYVVEIAISSFESVKGSGFAIERSISDELRRLKISSKSVRSFIIAITNLLDNCYRRSGFGRETKVKIRANYENGMAEIVIANNVNVLEAILLTDDFISQIDSKMRAPESLDFMRTEGGSGISKAYNEVASLSEKSDLQLAYINNEFCAIIKYEP